MRIIDAPIPSYVIHINSRDCQKSQEGIYTFNLNNPIRSPMFYDMIIYTSNFECPFTLYNINEYNNSLKVIEDGLQINISVPYGNYTPKTLTNYLLGALGANWSISFSSTTGKLTFKSKIENSFIFANQSTLRDVIGFDNEVYELTQYDPATEYYYIESPFVCNFNYTNCLYLISDLANNSSYDTMSNTLSNILCKIPIDTNFGNMIFYSAVQSPNKLLYNSKFINRISFSLCDDRKRPINLNGTNNYFEFSLNIDFTSMQPFQQDVNLGEQKIVNQ